MKKIVNVFFVMTLLLGGWGLSSCDEAGAIQGGEDIEQEEGKDNNGDADDDDDIPEPVIKGIALYPSSPLIVADGTDTLALTVKFDGVDVTESAIIYMNSKRMEGNLFATEVSGSYKFFASYKGKISNAITINAVSPALYVELPEDPKANKFSNFQRKVLVAKGTGTWCGYCPYMIEAFEKFRENGSNAGKAVLVAAHSNYMGTDVFTNEASEAARLAMRITGFPTCVLNLNPDVLIENNYPEVTAEKINSMVGMELKEAARVGIAAATAVNRDSSLIVVRAAVKVGVEGRYRVSAWLIEDGVSEYQINAGVIDHMHILRDASCISPIQGQLLGEKEVCLAGEIFEHYHEFNVPKAQIADVKNCKVAVFVTSAADATSNYYVNNIIECHVGESVPFS